MYIGWHKSVSLWSGEWVQVITRIGGEEVSIHVLTDLQDKVKSPAQFMKKRVVCLARCLQTWQYLPYLQQHAVKVNFIDSCHLMSQMELTNVSTNQYSCELNTKQTVNSYSFEICTLMGYYKTFSGITLKMFWDSLSVPFSAVKTS